MKVQHYFLASSLPGFWDNLESMALQAITLWDLEDQSLVMKSLFPDLVAREVVEAKPYLISRAFNVGAANPVAQSLAMLLKLPEDKVRVDRLILLENNRVDDDLYLKLQQLWREPAIEEVKICKSSEWFQKNSEEPLLKQRRDPSWDECKPGEHGLEFTPDETRVLKEHAEARQRPWSRTELELIAQTWSEHCKHKIFNAKIRSQDTLHSEVDSLFKTYIRKPALEISEKKPGRYLSMFHDNAGVIAIDKSDGSATDWALCVKMETHNSPSAISPYGGASTGIVGVHRDILGTGLGALPIFNWDVLCLEQPLSRHKRPEGALHPDVIRQGVIKGIEDGGNQSGIPTVQGSVVFHPGYAVKPLVYAGSAGLLPKSFVNKTPAAGQILYSVGGAVGADGLRGAVMSSRDIRSEDFCGSMVQVANAFVQRRLTEFLIEARDKGFVQCVTDNGAGGFASSIGEMATLSGGAKVDLSNIRCKFHGLHGWERLLSESQERMTVATAKVKDFEELAASWQVPIDRLGELTSSGRLEVNYQGKVLVDMSLDFLHEACPQLNLESHWSFEKENAEIEALSPQEIRVPDIKEDFPTMLSSVHLCSREGIVRRFDHEVQGRTLRQAFAGRTQESAQDGSVMEIYEADAFVSLAHGLSPWRHDIHENVLHSWDEALRQSLLAGARLETAAVLDNFSWPDPIKEDRYLWHLLRSCELLASLSRHFEIPFISGKDSMKNNSKDFFVPPTLVISLCASASAPENLPAGFFLRPNDVVITLEPLRSSLKDSAWERVFLQRSKTSRGSLFEASSAKDIEEDLMKLCVDLKDRYKRVEEAVSRGLFRSAKDVSEGGLLHCLFEMTLGRRLGVLFENSKMDPYEAFSEGLGSFVFAVDPHFVKDVEKLFPEHRRLGVVHKVPELLWRPGDMSLSVEELAEKYLEKSEAGFWG